MGRGYVGYRPERPVPVASEAEIQAMHSKLAQRAGRVSTPTPVQRSEAVQSPKEKSALEWEKPVVGGTAVKTKCGRYSCCKVTTNGKLHYELWKFVPSGGWFTRIDKGSGLDNFLQAQVMAQQDFEKQ